MQTLAYADGLPLSLYSGEVELQRLGESEMSTSKPTYLNVLIVEEFETASGKGRTW